MFRKLRDLFRQPQPSGHPFNLTSPEVAALKRLSTNADYRALQEALDTLLILQGEQLLAARDAFQLAHMQGVLVGIRRAGSLVDEVLQHEAHADADRNRSNARPERNDAARRLATFGTPAWTDKS